MAQNRDKPFDPVLYLVSVRFPKLHDYIFGDGRRRASDYPSLSEQEQSDIKQYSEELRRLPSEELLARVARARQTDKEKLIQEAQAEEDKRFFNQSYCNADLKYWARMSYWSPEEFVALSFGKDPNRVNWTQISQYQQISSFARQYSMKREAVTRAVATGQLWQQTPPNLAVAWAMRMRFELPSALLQEIESLGIQVADWKTFHDERLKEVKDLNDRLEREREAHLQSRANALEDMKEYSIKANSMIDGYKELVEKLSASNQALMARIRELEERPPVNNGTDLGPRERENLLRLIITMAVDGYGYDPKARRSPIARELSDIMLRRGMSLSDDTIRNLLKEAKDLIPGVDPF